MTVSFDLASNNLDQEVVQGQELPISDQEIEEEDDGSDDYGISYQINALDQDVLNLQPSQLAIDIPSPPGLTALGITHWKRDKHLLPETEKQQMPRTKKFGQNA